MKMILPRIVFSSVVAKTYIRPFPSWLIPRGIIVESEQGRRLISSNASSKEGQKSATESRFLEGRVALVTGSTSGIGLGVARGLASRGCNILLNGFGDEELIKSIQAELAKEYKIKANYFPVDLANETEIAAYVQKINMLYPDGIGFQHVSPVEDFPVDKWNSLIAVLLSAPFHLIRLLLPDMRRRGWGRIINVASVHGVIASPFKSAYTSAKHGLVGLTKVVALETAGSGVTCNSISPGYVDTSIFQKQVQTLADKENLDYNTAKAKFLAVYHPSKEAVGIDQIAETAVFMCTEAASQMTGSNIVLDGGWTAR